jgi:hypothetical protein
MKFTNLKPILRCWLHQNLRWRSLVLLISVLMVGVMLAVGIKHLRQLASMNPGFSDAGAGAERVKLDAITLAKLEGLRDRIRHRIPQFETGSAKEFSLPYVQVISEPICRFPVAAPKAPVEDRRIGFISHLPPLIRARCSPQARTDAIIKHGGSMASEAAVEKTLVWLRTHQNPDGSWGRHAQGGTTSLALLCFLAHCETPDSPTNGACVLAGATFLIDLAGKHAGRFSATPADQPLARQEHAIGMIAISELYKFAKFGPTLIPRLRESLEEGAELLQHHDLTMSGWQDASADGVEFNTMILQLEAFRALSGISLRLPIKFTGRAVFLKYYDRGKELADGPAPWGKTLLDCLLREQFAVEPLQEHRKASQFKQLLAQPFAWADSERLPAWTWMTGLCFQEGGAIWEQWQNSCIHEILTQQNLDGSYAGKPGAAALTSTSEEDDAIARACYATLILETYYRHQRRD